MAYSVDRTAPEWKKRICAECDAFFGRVTHEMLREGAWSGNDSMTWGLRIDAPDCAEFADWWKLVETLILNAREDFQKIQKYGGVKVTTLSQNYKASNVGDDIVITIGFRRNELQ